MTPSDKLSKLNWIECAEAPNIADVIGKFVITQSKSGVLCVTKSLSHGVFFALFYSKSDPVLRYAIIDTSEPEVAGKMKTFCPNCEKETDCVHEAELYACNECGGDFAKYIVSRKHANSDVLTTQNVLTDIKTPNSIENSSKEAENRNTNPDYYNRPSESDSSETQAERLEPLIEAVPNLLPCPFCGIPPYWTPVKVYGNGEKSPAIIKCRKCNYNMHEYDNDDLFEKWNTRSGVNNAKH